MLKGVKTNPANNIAISWQDHKEQLVLIECECGTKILLLPDLKEMNQAIEAHVTAHKKMEKSNRKAEITARKIRQNLTKQIIAKAADTKQFR
ncbi:MAG: hypothetical protein ABSA75_12360 [Candidatus Bathyarchaeia archaeon]|jgi:hypothetical protein